MTASAPASNSMSAKKLASLHVGAIVFSETRGYFKAKELSEFYARAGIMMDEEGANEMLLELCRENLMREIGPATYAKPVSSTEQQQFADRRQQGEVQKRMSRANPPGDFVDK